MWYTGNTWLTKIGDEFPDLKSFKFHDGFTWRPAADEAVAGFLSRCHSLESLDLSGNIEAPFWPLFENLPTTLRRLDISNCDSVSKEALMAIPVKCPELVYRNIGFLL